MTDKGVKAEDAVNLSENVLPWGLVLDRLDPTTTAYMLTLSQDERVRFLQAVAAVRRKREAGALTDYPVEPPTKRMWFARFLVQTRRLREDLP